MPLISIIVPIYNGEKYLRRCIDSVLAQSWVDFELILINDGSCDKSLSVCEEYAVRDNRIKVIDQLNAGVSVARNTGIEAAEGRYICFVDCDDWVDTNYLELLYENLTNADAELAVTGYREVNEEGSNTRDTRTIACASVFTAEEAMFHLFEAIGFMSFCYPWGKLFKADIISRHHIKFNPAIAIGEDRLFIFDYLHHASKVSCTSVSTYNYLMNSCGAMNTLKGFDLKYLTCFDALDMMLCGEMPKKVKRQLHVVYVSILLKMKKFLNEANATDCKEFSKRLNAIADRQMFLFSNIPFRWRLKLFLSYKIGIIL